MEYFSTDFNTKMSPVLKELGVFFAFSAKQFEEKKVEGVKYKILGAGTICPKDNVQKFLSECDRITKEVTEARLKKYGLKRMVFQELDNHECMITWDAVPAINALVSQGLDRGTLEEFVESNWNTYTSQYN